MKNKLRKIIRDYLGITSLVYENKELQFKNERCISEINELRRVLGNTIQDNQQIMAHLEFLNSHFVAVADVSYVGSDRNVLIVIQRCGEQIIKELQLTPNSIEELYHMIQGFGKRNAIVDKPRGFKPPTFRY